jgi:two-component system, OmpR family, sensor kinase
MRIAFVHRLYVRLWLAVVLAVLVLSILVAWLLRTQAERIRAERLAEVPAREVVMRDAQGQIVGNMTVKPVRVPGRGVEFHIQLPEGVRGGEQLAISMPPRQHSPAGEGMPTRGSRDGREAREGRGWGWMGGSDRGASASMGLAAMLVAFALAVALGSYPVVRRLTKRLENLQSGVERVGAGDLGARVDESGRDEVAFLAQRFNRAFDQVQALVQSQQSLLANASHELRSPLARIRMGLELMETAPSASLKTEIARSIAELDALIEEILLASRLQTAASGALQAVREPVDVLALAAEEGARAGVPVAWQGDAASAVLPGDARLLRRMMRNLLENAQRHGGGEVSLALAVVAGQLQLEVADRGPGVPLPERERIFEPFYRSSQASERQGGVGLGLSLVRSIARQHLGAVQCLEREGGGARFVVSLPLAASA